MVELNSLHIREILKTTLPTRTGLGTSVTRLQPPPTPVLLCTPSADIGTLHHQ